MTERRAMRAFGGLGLLLTALIVVRAAGAGTLGAPPTSSGRAFLDWVDDRGPATVAMSLVRLATEGVLWYLVALAAVVVVAELTRSTLAGRVADVVAAPIPDRIIRVALGITLATAGQPVSLASGDLTAGSRGTVTMVALEGDDASAGIPTMERLDPASDDVADDLATGGPVDTLPGADSGTARGTPWPDGRPGSTPVVETPEPTVDTSSPTPSTWTVAEGESFWVIAAETLSEQLGHEPTDADVVPYWLALIDANRDRLVDPDDPDLILPGQVFELPEPSVP